MTLEKGSQVGPYVIIEALNRGGMAQIYRARDRSSRRDVALKLSLDNHQKVTSETSLRREVDLLTKLDHPGVIKVLPINLKGAKKSIDNYMAREPRIPGTPWYYAMEYLPGGSLDDLLKQHGTLQVSLAALIGLRLAKTLRYIHREEVVHLDIKPHNVLLRHPLINGASIAPVLIDYGISAQTKEQAARGGTLVTMAPEYIRKNRGESAPEQSIDLTRVDIYAMGVVMYRMWTGKYPFDGISRGSVTSAILNEKVRSPRELNPALPYQTDQLLLEWLSKDPLARPSLDEIIKELEYLTAGLKKVPDDFVSNAPKSKLLFWRR